MAQTIPFPPELRAKWQEILKTAAEIGGWFDGYVDEHSAAMGAPGVGRRLDDEGDLPSEPPTEVPVWSSSEEANWADFPDKEMYASEREFEHGAPPHVVHATGWEFVFGTFAVFRVTKEQSDRLNEGYEDTAGTDNERIIEDGDHRIVVYMQ